MKQTRRAVPLPYALAAFGTLALAACGDRTPPPVAPLSPTLAPSFAVSAPSNGIGAEGNSCMENDLARLSNVNNTTPSCTANDIRIAFATVTAVNGTPLGGQPLRCTPGEILNLSITATLQATSNSNREDIGVWIGTGATSANARQGTCAHYNLAPTTAGGGATNPVGTINGDNDACAGMAQGASTQLDLGSIPVQCNVVDGQLRIGSCISWKVPGQDESCPTGYSGGTSYTADQFRQATLPGTGAKCNCEGFGIAAEVVGKIRIVKDAQPNDAQNFSFTHTVSSSPTVTSPFLLDDDGDATLSNTQLFENVVAGTYTFTEASVAGWTLSARSCVVTGSSTPATFNTSVAGTIALTLAAGQDVTCTFTNTRDTGTIEVKKVWVGTPGQTTLQIGTAAGGAQVKAQLTGAAGAAPLTTGTTEVTTGTYFVSETGGLTDYTSSLACTDDGSPLVPGANQSVSVAKGHAVVCTFTNTRNTGTIEVKKVWVGTPGQTTLQIGTSAGGAQVKSQLTGAAGAAPLTTGATSVNTGTYFVSETGGLADYSQVLACTKNGDAYVPGANQSVVVASNDVVVCTFTNTRAQGSIEVRKVWVGTPGQTTLQIGTAAGGAQVATQLTGAAGAAPLTTGAKAVNTGTFYVSETGGLTDYTSSLACTRGGTPFTPGASQSVVVGVGDVVVCTFTNTRKTGTVEVKKVWVGTGGQTTLQIGTAAGGAQTKSQLTGAAGAAPLTTGATQVNTGTYYVSETGGLTGYTSSLACTKNGGAYVPGANQSVVVAENDVVVCTFTNTELATLIVQKVVNGGSLQSFSFTRATMPAGVASSFSLTNGQSSTTGKVLLPGSYTVCETNIPVGWTTSVTVNGGSVTPTNPDLPQDLGNKCVTTVLAAGGTATVVWTNSPPPQGDARTIGYWKNWSSCAQSKGGQFDRAKSRGDYDRTLDENLNVTIGLLTFTAGNLAIGGGASASCEQAVAILDKRDFSGAKRAGDPLFNMAAQLLAAMVNINADAAPLCIQPIIAEANALLVKYNWAGVYPYTPALTPTDAARANVLAGLLDQYNNNTLACPIN